jgi:hypothetical protein
MLQTKSFYQGLPRALQLKLFTFALVPCCRPLHLAHALFSLGIPTLQIRSFQPDKLELYVTHAMSLAVVAAPASLYHFVVLSHIHVVTTASTSVGVVHQCNEEMANVACLIAFVGVVRRPSDITPANEDVRIGVGCASDGSGAVEFVTDR